MRCLNPLKDHLLENLWCPMCMEGGKVFYPRLRKNKKMKIFTLTNDVNFREIPFFIDNKLIQEEEHLVWTSTSLKKIRLETELSDVRVLQGLFKEEEHSRNPHFLEEYFPKDILNLDFSSQNQESLCEGEIKKELESMDGIIGLEDRKGANGFVLIYTTILEEAGDLNVNEIKISLGLNELGQEENVEESVQTISTLEDKKRNIYNLMKRICKKYNYNELKINDVLLNIPQENKKLYSIAGIFKK